MREFGARLLPRNRFDLGRIVHVSKHRQVQFFLNGAEDLETCSIPGRENSLPKIDWLCRTMI
jgi:hypothetical protein